MIGETTHCSRSFSDIDVDADVDVDVGADVGADIGADVGADIGTDVGSSGCFGEETMNCFE